MPSDTGQGHAGTLGSVLGARLARTLPAVRWYMPGPAFPPVMHLMAAGRPTGPRRRGQRGGLSTAGWATVSQQGNWRGHRDDRAAWRACSTRRSRLVHHPGSRGDRQVQQAANEQRPAQTPTRGAPGRRDQADTGQLLRLRKTRRGRSALLASAAHDHSKLTHAGAVSRSPIPASAAMPSSGGHRLWRQPAQQPSAGVGAGENLSEGVEEGFVSKVLPASVA